MKRIALKESVSQCSRSLVFAAFGFIVASIALLRVGAAEQKAKPNIVLIVTDDQGYGDLGFTGNPVIKTPHIDQLASESSQLTDYHVAPTCSPTRSALLTGH